MSKLEVLFDDASLVVAPGASDGRCGLPTAALMASSGRISSDAEANRHIDVMRVLRKIGGTSLDKLYGVPSAGA